MKKPTIVARIGHDESYKALRNGPIDYIAGYASLDIVRLHKLPKPFTMDVVLEEEFIKALNKAEDKPWWKRLFGIFKRKPKEQMVTLTRTELTQMVHVILTLSNFVMTKYHDPKKIEKIVTNLINNPSFIRK